MLRKLFIASVLALAATQGNAQATPPAADSVYVEIGKARGPVALRTNLLLDLVGTPNIGLIVPVSEKISLEADFAYSHWTINNTYSFQTVQGGVAAKYWFGFRKNKPLTGWNAGVYAVYCGLYDVQWKDGWQGDGFWSAGVSGAYSASISKRLNMEFLLAAGYFRTSEARHYHHPENGHLMWRQTKRNVGRFSLTKAQVNLVWLLRKTESK